ncbi:hypothetical protein BY996DRAFT_4592501 [Phakopsora pachyrhizi]|nr:hypothetical protein BY996DRAFT_4592501 [Phakopsora pachyrhizi]
MDQPRIVPLNLTTGLRSSSVSSSSLLILLLSCLPSSHPTLASTLIRSSADQPHQPRPLTGLEPHRPISLPSSLTTIHLRSTSPSFSSHHPPQVYLSTQPVRLNVPSSTDFLSTSSPSFNSLNPPQASTSSPAPLRTSLSSSSTSQPASRISLSKRQLTHTDPSQLPEIFDTSLGVEFESSTCSPFIRSMLADPEFKACYPFSLLLTTSHGFFKASQLVNGGANQINTENNQTITLSEILDTTCSVQVSRCQATMRKFAADIKSTPKACGIDLEKKNSLAVETMNGLSNYDVMRQVGCLLNTDQPSVPATPNLRPNTTLSNRLISGSSPSTAQSSAPKYCYEKAVRSNKPDDHYLYHLPSGTGLPSGTKPSCDQCNRDIMKIFSSAAEDPGLQLQSTFGSARTMTNSICGTGFASLPKSLAVKMSSSTLSSSIPHLILKLLTVTWIGISFSSSLF